MVVIMVERAVVKMWEVYDGLIDKTNTVYRERLFSGLSHRVKSVSSK